MTKKIDTRLCSEYIQDYLRHEGWYTQANRLDELVEAYVDLKKKEEILVSALEQIRSMYVELSIDKAYYQRNKMIEIAANALLDAYPPIAELSERKPLSDDF